MSLGVAYRTRRRTSVWARPDGRYTLLGITQPKDFTPSCPSVSDVTVPGPWAVYAGRLAVPRCG